MHVLKILYQIVDFVVSRFSLNVILCVAFNEHLCLNYVTYLHLSSAFTKLRKCNQLFLAQYYTNFKYSADK